jgi:hypothetical protein
MTRLIDISDFTDFPAISVNTNVSKKLNPYIMEAQELDLLPILGQEFYWALISDFEASPSLTDYGGLFNGSTYTIQNKTYKHKGLKPVLLYFTYARYRMNAQEEETATGLVTKNNPYSEPASEKAIARRVDQARSAAFAYMEPVRKFLNDNYLDYPLWKKDCDSSGNKRSIRISGI